MARTILAACGRVRMGVHGRGWVFPVLSAVGMAGVVLENVSRNYPGGVQAVRGINLKILDREFLVLVGPSGCGKTTTLRLIAGLEELSGGTITIGARIVNDVPPKDRDIAMVFQNYALYPHLTVYKNLAFGLELREGLNSFDWMWRWALPAGRKADLARRRFAVADRVHRAARTLGIEPLLDRLPRQLSGGERQRVALGRAIVRDPAVFLFDEPLSNLDAKLRVEMRRELKQLHQQLAATMIYVTHDQVEALTLGERIVVMNEGVIQQVGKPMDLYDWPANRFVAGFLGTPGMNFVEGSIGRDDSAGGGGASQFSRGTWSVDLPQSRSMDVAGGSRPAVLGVRPEDVSIAPASADETATDAVVRLVEMLGDSTVATIEVLTTTEFSLLARLGPRSNVNPGDRVGVRLNAARVHLFDPQTGESWVRRSPGN